MTVKELKEKLKNVPDDYSVRIYADCTEFLAESAGVDVQENCFYVGD